MVVEEMTQNEANFRHAAKFTNFTKNNCMLLSCCLAVLDSWPHALVHFSVACVRFVPDQLHHYALCARLPVLPAPQLKKIKDKQHLPVLTLYYGAD